MRKSGWRISVDSRSYIPTVDDPALSLRVMRPQEMPRYIADGHLDAAITGSDWVMENDVDLVKVESFIYAKVSLQTVAMGAGGGGELAGQTARGPGGQARRDRDGRFHATRVRANAKLK